MRELPIRAFEESVSLIIKERADFLLIAGDLYNTPVPPLDMVKRSVTQFQRLKKAGIPVYVIAGSHDYSPSGKTMLDVLEEAGLLVNVMRGSVVTEGGRPRLKLSFTTDEKTGAKITGIIGRAGSLDKAYYEDLDRDALEREPGEKIFLFHNAITELKPERYSMIDSAPVTMLPKNFSYYAGGHLHVRVEERAEGYERVVYPGPLFPAHFAELEELGNGAFCLVEEWRVRSVPVTVRERLSLHVNADGKSVEEVNEELAALKEEEVKGKIILLRVSGELRTGRTSDLRLKELVEAWEERGAYHVMKNTTKLSERETEEFQTSHGSAEELEERIIREHAGQGGSGLSPEEEVRLARELLAILGEEQPEGAVKHEHEERVVRAAKEQLWITKKEEEERPQPS